MMLLNRPLLSWLRAAVFCCFAVVAAYADAPWRGNTMEIQGTESKTVFMGHSVFASTVRVDGGLWFDGSDIDSCLTIAEGHTLVLTERLHLERRAGVVVNGGTLEAPDGITLGCTVGNFGGRLEMRAGELITSGIMLLNNNENTVNITGGTLTVTGPKAFDYDGLHDMSTVSISRATLRTAGCSWALNHGAVLTDVMIAAERGKSITIGAADAVTIARGTLVNEGKLVLGGEVSLARLVNKGRIDSRHHTLVLTEAVGNGGSTEGTGELRLAAGTNLFRTLRAGTLAMLSPGTHLKVRGGDGLTVECVVLGHLRNSISADRLGQEHIIFHADAAELSNGAYPLLVLENESDLTAMSLVIKGQTIEVDDDPMLINGTSHLLDLVISPDGRSLLLIVTPAPLPEPSASAFCLLALSVRAAWRRRT